MIILHLKHLLNNEMEYQRKNFHQRRGMIVSKTTEKGDVVIIISIIQQVGDGKTTNNECFAAGQWG